MVLFSNLDILLSFEPRQRQKQCHWISCSGRYTRCLVEQKLVWSWHKRSKKHFVWLWKNHTKTRKINFSVFLGRLLFSNSSYLPSMSYKHSFQFLPSRTKCNWSKKRHFFFQTGFESSLATTLCVGYWFKSKINITQVLILSLI